MPLGWVAAAGVVGSLASGAMQAGAASDAANAQAQSAANAQGISQQQYQDTVNRNAPFTQSGYGALSALDWGLGISPQTSGGQPVGGTGGSTPNGYDPSSGYRMGPGGSISQAVSNPGGLGSVAGGSHIINPSPNMTGSQGMGPVGGSGLPINTGAGAPAGGQTGGLGYGSLTKAFDTSDWQKLSPAYNFQLRQGQQGVMNADAAGAGALSGSAQKDLIDYNQNAANQSFNSAFNQYQTQQGNIFSRLSGIAQLGQSSANNTGQQGTALAGQAAQSATNIGTAQAGGYVGAANAISGGVQSALPWLSSYAGGGSNNNPRNWDTENPSNFQDFQSSDRRLKTDINLVGKLMSGLNVYTFRYSESPTVVHMGVMADEVAKVIPQAVSTDDNGYLQVSYRMLR